MRQQQQQEMDVFTNVVEDARQYFQGLPAAQDSSSTPQSSRPYEHGAACYTSATKHQSNTPTTATSRPEVTDPHPTYIQGASNIRNENNTPHPPYNFWISQNNDNIKENKNDVTIQENTKNNYYQQMYPTSQPHQYSRLMNNTNSQYSYPQQNHRTRPMEQPTKIHYQQSQTPKIPSSHSESLYNGYQQTSTYCLKPQSPSAPPPPQQQYSQSYHSQSPVQSQTQYLSTKNESNEHIIHIQDNTQHRRTTHNLPPIAALSSVNYHSNKNNREAVQRVTSVRQRPQSYSNHISGVSVPTSSTTVPSSIYSTAQQPVRASTIYTNNTYTTVVHQPNHNSNTQNQYQFPVVSSPAYPSVSNPSTTSKIMYPQSSYPQYFQKLPSTSKTEQRNPPEMKTGPEIKMTHGNDLKINHGSEMKTNHGMEMTTNHGINNGSEMKMNLSDMRINHGTEMKTNSSEMRISHGSEVKMNHGSDMKMNYASEVKMNHGSDMKMNYGSEVKMNHGSDMKMNHGSDMKLNHGSDMKMNYGSEVKMNHGSDMKMNHGSDMKMNYGSEVKMNHGSDMKMNYGSEVKMNHGSDMKMNYGSEVKMNHGSDMKMNYGSEVKMNHGSDMKMNYGSEVKMNHGSDMKMNYGSEVKMNHGSDMKINHGSEMKLMSTPDMKTISKEQNRIDQLRNEINHNQHRNEMNYIQNQNEMNHNQNRNEINYNQNRNEMSYNQNRTEINHQQRSEISTALTEAMNPKQKRESPLDLSVKTVRTSADSTALDDDNTNKNIIKHRMENKIFQTPHMNGNVSQYQRNLIRTTQTSVGAPKVDFLPNFSASALQNQNYQQKNVNALISQKLSRTDAQEREAYYQHQRELQHQQMREQQSMLHQSQHPVQHQQHQPQAYQQQHQSQHQLQHQHLQSQHQQHQSHHTQHQSQHPQHLQHQTQHPQHQLQHSQHQLQHSQHLPQHPQQSQHHHPQQHPPQQHTSQQHPPQQHTPQQHPPQQHTPQQHPPQQHPHQQHHPQSQHSYHPLHNNRQYTQVYQPQESKPENLPRFDFPLDGNNGYRKPTYTQDSRKRTLEPPNETPPKILKVDPWRQKIDQQIEQRLNSYTNSRVQQEQLYKMQPNQQFVKPVNNVPQAKPPSYGNNPQYFQQYRNQYPESAPGYEYPQNNYDSMYAMNNLSRSNSLSKLPTKVNNVGNQADKRILSLLRNSLESKGAKEAQKKLETIKPVNTVQSGIQHPTMDVTAPLQPKPSIHIRHNVSPFTASGLLERTSNTPPNYKYHFPRAVDSIKYETDTPERDNTYPSEDKPQDNPTGTTTDLDGLAAFLAARIRTKAELKQVGTSQEQKTEAPKLPREQIVVPPRRKLFSKSEDDPTIPNGTLTVPPRNTTLRSSSETSVFDFPDSDSETEMPVLERQSLHDMRKDRKSNKIQTLPPPDEKPEVIDETPDTDWDDICGKFVEQLQKNNGKKRGRRKKTIEPDVLAQLESVAKENPIPNLDIVKKETDIDDDIKKEIEDVPEESEYSKISNFPDNSMNAEFPESSKFPEYPESSKFPDTSGNDSEHSKFLDTSENSNFVDILKSTKFLNVLDGSQYLDDSQSSKFPPVLEIPEIHIKQEKLDEIEVRSEAGSDDVPLNKIKCPPVKKEENLSEDEEVALISRKNEKLGAKIRLDYSSDSDSDNINSEKLESVSRKLFTRKSKIESKDMPKMILRSADSSPVKTKTTIFLKKKAIYGDGSDFHPGWEEEVYRYKRSIRMPTSLITVSRPHWHRMSTSLPDLDACSPAPSSLTDDIDFLPKAKLESKIKREILDSDSNSSFCVKDEPGSSKTKKSTKKDVKEILKNNVKDSINKISEKNSSILDVLVERYGKHKRKKNKLKSKGPKIIEKTLNPLLPTPSLGIGNNEKKTDKLKKGKTKTKDDEDKKEDAMELNNSVYLGFFRKETVATFRDTFKGIEDSFTPVLLKSRTRTETRVMKKRATIREVFGEDRPASAPPITVVEEIKEERIEPEKEDKEKVEKKEKLTIREGLRSATTPTKKVYNLKKRSGSAKSPDTKEIKIDSKSDAKSSTKSDVRLDTKLSLKSDVKSDKTNVKTDVKSDVKSDGKVDAKLDTKIGSKSDGKLNSKSDMKSETKLKSDPKSISKFDTKLLDLKIILDSSFDTKSCSSDTKTSPESKSSKSTTPEMKSKTDVESRIFDIKMLEFDDKISIKSETMSVTGDEAASDVSTSVPGKKRFKLRKKCSSGFDYIRKKKKVIKKENASGDDKTVVKRRRGFAPRPSPESESDIQKEIKTWVMNKGVGETHLHRAARLGYTDIIAYCLEKLDYSPSPKDNAGYTPLHEACSKGHLDIARLLLLYGANVSDSAQGGIRPLHEAAENGFVEIVRLLLSYGADPMLATYSGYTPLMLASDEEMKAVLKNYMADIEAISAPHWHFNGPASFFDPEMSGYNPLNDAPDPESELELSDIEMEISEVPLPNLYILEDEPINERWVLLQDLSTILKIKSRDTLLRQINTGPTQISAKGLIRELKFSEFLEKAHCCQLLGGNEKINARSTKIALVKYTDKVKKLLGVEKFVVPSR